MPDRLDHNGDERADNQPDEDGARHLSHHEDRGQQQCEHEDGTVVIDPLPPTPRPTGGDGNFVAPTKPGVH